MNALLGSTGFVGSTLRRQSEFGALYNSRNIDEIRGKSFGRIVCAAAPAAKWKANQDPEGDRANLARLMAALRDVRAGEFVLISTVDVFRMPPAADEGTAVTPERVDAYGRHRFELEEFVRKHFPNSLVVRLPGLFGAGLRKNFLFDMIHFGNSEWTHGDSVFQFYNICHLWSDLQLVLRADPKVRLVHFATEPVQSALVARNAFDVEYCHETSTPPVTYDLRTRFAHLWDRDGDYIASAEEVVAQIREFAELERLRL